MITKEIGISVAFDSPSCSSLFLCFKNKAHLVLFNILLLIFVVCLALDYFLEKPINLQDAHVLVTGGSSGIGKEVAREALKLGAKVTIVARDVKKLESALNDLKNTSSKDS